MSETHSYKYLRDDPGSKTKLLFLLDPRKFRADHIYGQCVGEDALTPEEVAAGLELPLEAVREAIDYCERNLELVHAERRRENAILEEYDRRQKPLQPPKDLEDA
jgi:hypothetical protein